MSHWLDLSADWQTLVASGVAKADFSFNFVPEDTELNTNLVEFGDIIRGADIRSDEWIAEEVRLYLKDATYATISPYLATDTESLLRVTLTLTLTHPPGYTLSDSYVLGHWRLQKVAAQRMLGKFSVGFDSLLKRLTETYARATPTTLYGVKLPDRDGNQIDKIIIGNVETNAPHSQRFTIRFIAANKYTVYSDLYGQLWNGVSGFVDYATVGTEVAWWVGPENGRYITLFVTTGSSLICKVGTLVDIDAEYQNGATPSQSSPLDETKRLIDRAIGAYIFPNYDPNFSLNPEDAIETAEWANQQMFAVHMKETGPTDIMSVIKGLISTLGMMLIDRPGTAIATPSLKAIPLHGRRTPAIVRNLTTDDISINAVQQSEPLGGYSSVVVIGSREDGSDFIAGYPTSSGMGTNTFKFQSSYFREGACEALAEHLWKILHPRTPIYILPGGYKLATLEPGEIYNLTLDAPYALTNRKVMVFKKTVRGLNFGEGDLPKDPVVLEVLDITDWTRADQDVAGTSTFVSNDKIW